MAANDFDRLVRIVEGVVANQKLLAAGLALAHGIEVGLADLEDVDPPWLAFLDEHPELDGKFEEAGTYPDGSPRRAHYSYRKSDVPDDRIVAALEKLNRSRSEGATTEEVLAVLFGSAEEARVRHDDRLAWAIGDAPQQVGNRLWSLTLRGVVERVRKRQGSTPALWRLAD